jgi:hypothetical protein
MHRIRRLLAVLVAALALLSFVAPPAFASNSDGPSSPRAFDLNSWPVILAGATGFLSSQATAILTNHRAPQWIKSLTNLALTSLGGVLITVQTIPGHTWKDYAGTIFAAWLVSLGTHFAGLTALAQNASAGFGFGANAAPLVPPTGTTVTSTGATTVTSTDAGDGGAY